MPAFTPGNLVVYRVGATGAVAAPTSAAAPVFLDEYTPTGTFVQSIAMPTADSGTNQMLTASGTSVEGLLNRSEDGRYLVLTGYDAQVGTASVSGTSTAVGASQILRVIGRVDANGNVDTSTTTTAFSGSSIRSAVSSDGTAFWAVGGNTGVIYEAFGASTHTVVSSTFTTLRSIDIFGDQLYVSGQTGALRIGAVGSGEPTTSPQTIAPLPGIPLTTGASTNNTSPYQFVFADLSAAVAGVDTLYVADDRSIANGGGLYKFSLVSGSWVLNGTATGSLANGLRGLTGSVSGTTVTLYATTASTAANAIVSVIDSGGYNAAFSTTTLTSIATAGANTVFRGIDFAPQAAVAPVETQTVQFNPTSVTQAEGDAGLTAYTFTVTRTGGTTGILDFSGTIGAGTTDAADFENGILLTTFSGSIAAGATSATVTVNVAGDVAVELDESFQLTLTSATNQSGVAASIGANSAATGTITNDDNAGSLTIGDVALAEGSAGTATIFSFTVTRSGGSDGAVSATWTLDAPGGAGVADAGDFDGTQQFTGSVAFANGETVKTIEVKVLGDIVFEANEAFSVTLSLPQGGVAIGDASGDGTIQNDDAAPAGTFSIDDVSHSEGDGGATTTYTFTVSRTGGSGGAVTVDYNIPTAGGAGLADGSDFVAGSIYSGTLNFADGVTTQTIMIDVQGDAVFEADETFAVDLSNATGGAGIDDATGTGTIVNDDLQPAAGSVSIADAQIVEGNAGTSTLILTLTRTGGTAAFAVNYATANGGNPNNASATSGSDYVAASGTISFAEGETSKTIPITINGDTTAELSEEFSVTLSGATNGATLSDATAVATITTDDALSTGPANPWINEFHYDNAGADTGEFVEIAGAAGTSLTGWTLALYNGNPSQLSVYSTIALSGTIPDQSGGFGTVSVAATGIQNGGAGAAGEPDAIALVNNLGQVVEFISYEGSLTAASGPASGMTSTNVGVFEPGDANGTSIVRTSGPPGATWAVSGSPTPGAINGGQTLPSSGTAVPGIAVSDVSVNEAAGTMTFTVTRTNVAAGAFTVNYATADGSATAGSDYVASSGMLSFTDNQVSASVTVTVNDDATPELDETILLNLSGATGGAVISDAQGVGTIVNDDGTPIQVSINDVSIVEGNSGTSILTFTVTRTGGTGAFDVDFATVDGTAVAPGDYLANSRTLSFGAGINSQTVEIIVNGDLTPESTEAFQAQLSGGTNGVIIVDGTGTGTIVNDEATFIHDIQGTAYYSPILAANGITGFNTASTTIVTVRAIVTAVDNVGNRQGYYLSEELADWDSNGNTSEGIFVMTRNDAGVGNVVAGVTVGDLIQVSAQVMEYQAFSTMPRTVLVNPTGLSIISSANALPILTLTNMPNEVMTRVTPDYTDSSDGAGDTFDASFYALSYYETVEGMLVTIPNMVVADGFVQTSGGDPYLQAYSLDSANADQINSRGGYTIAGDPPIGPPDTATPGDDTTNGGRVLHDGDVNPDIIEIDFTDFAMAAPAGLLENATMGDPLGDVTGIIDFDFTDRKLFVTAMEPGGFVNTGRPVQEVTVLGDDTRSLTVATFNVENLDPTDGAARFAALAAAIANNLNSPDIISIEEMQDNNGAAAGDGTSSTGSDASVTWQMLVDALNLATGARYQWVDQAPVYNAEGGQQSGNIRVGFLYNTDRVQLGDLAPDATLAERRQFTDRIGDGVRDAGDRIAFSDDMLGGEINTADWTTTRKSLLGEFTFAGNTVYVTANHWPAKGGSGDFWQFDQNLAAGQPDNSDWAQRNAVAQDVYSMMNLIQSGAPAAGIVAGGDFNDFYFYQPLTTLTGHTLADGTARVGGARFDNLTLTLSEAERYTYTFDGRSQAIDHIIANGMLSAVASYDIVHLNTGYNTRGTGPDASPGLSDHDPAVASFNFASLSETLVGTPNRDIFRLEQGGDDHVSGLGGNDTFYFGAAFDENDFVDGDGGIDSIILDGNYPDLVLGTGTTSNIVGIETISLVPASFTDYDGSAAGSHSYDITTLDSNVASGGILKVNGFYLGAGENFTFDGSAETNGKFILLAGQGTDDLTGGAGNDIFVFGHDGRFAPGDRVAGGGGYDSIYLRGDYTIDFNNPAWANALSGIESVVLGGFADTQFVTGGDGEFDYAITWNDALLTGGRITFNGSGLGENETMSFDGTTEATAVFRLFGGASTDVLRGGDAGDLLYGGANGDTLEGNGGNDIFAYYAVTDSNSAARDGIQDFTLGDLIDLSVIDANVNVAGDQAFTIVTGAFTGAGQLRIVGAGPIVTVQGDINGDGIADLEILVTVADLHPLTATDFVL